MFAYTRVDAAWLIYGGVAFALGLAIWNLVPRVIRWALEDVIETTVTPQLDKVHNRIDAHMNTEESSFGELQRDLHAVKEVLDDRSNLFERLDRNLHDTQAIVSRHMDDDKAQFELSGRALVEGQRALLEHLAAIDVALKKKKKKKRRH